NRGRNCPFRLVRGLCLRRSAWRGLPGGLPRSPAAGVWVWLGRALSGDTGEIQGGTWGADMCGIAGIFAYHNAAPPVDGAELLRIGEAMVARGPDGAGLWISANKRVGLAHRRLAIIDLSETGAQPMATPDGRLQVVFNGEIYNYRELREELEAKGYRFRSTSDTEVLLHLYAEYGPGMVQCLRGMYAFAIWDEKNLGLFLARDPFGIKPLYYSDDGTTIRVASQVKALLKGGGIDTTPEPAGHVGFFLCGHV